LETIVDQILSAINSENLLTYLDQSNLYNRQERTLYTEAIANLHNQGKLDAIVEFEKLNRLDESYDFFRIKHLFEELLPIIDAPVLSVMSCLKHLFLESGEDMTAGMLISPFIKYCESKSDRPKEILSIALTNYDEKFDFITPALIAGSNIALLEFLETAIKLSQHENIHIRAKSIHALGNIKYQDNVELIQQAFEAISLAVKDAADSFIFATAIKAMFSLYTMNQSILEEMIELMTRIFEKKDDQVLYVLSEILWLNHDEMPSIMIELFLKELIDVNPEHNGTINNIDHVIADLLKKGYTTQVIDCIENILINNSQLSINKFDSFIREISQNDCLLNSLITRWFLSKRIRFGRCASDLIRAHGGDDYILSVDLVQIHGQQAGVHYFLAKKACGWFFINPISAASFIISLIDFAPNDEVQAIEELLLNPLLISYSGDLRVYIDEVSVKSSAKVQKILSEVLIDVENYHNDLRSVSKIVELRPSQAQRETYNRHHRQLMDESFKNAPKGFLSQLFKPTVLLYGNRSIHYVYHGQNGEKTRQEVPLHAISHSIELPSLEYLNPHGLDEMLRSFKLEGCTS
jgi:hypothetical protein